MSTAIVVTAVLVFIIGLFAALVDRTNQRDDALTLADESAADAIRMADRVAVLEAQVAELDQENARLHLELSEAQLLAGTGRVPLLRVVPNGGQS